MAAKHVLRLDTMHLYSWTTVYCKPLFVPTLSDVVELHDNCTVQVSPDCGHIHTQHHVLQVVCPLSVGAVPVPACLNGWQGWFC